MAIEKNDIKEIGVELMGQCIQLMAKIEIINTQEKEGVNSTEVESKLEHSSPKRKITTQDKKKWDAKSKTMYLEKCDFKTKHAYMHDGVLIHCNCAKHVGGPKSL